MSGSRYLRWPVGGGGGGGGGGSVVRRGGGERWAEWLVGVASAGGVAGVDPWGHDAPPGWRVAAAVVCVVV